MLKYVEELVGFTKEPKCRTCVCVQEELRRLLRMADDKQLKGKIHSVLLDHDLHYALDCTPCTPSEKRDEFLKRS